MANIYKNDFINSYSNCCETESNWKKGFKNLLFQYFPILTWLPKYTLYNLQCDFIAGITVGLMVIPQGLAYASIARLTNAYGLYSSFMGCFVYCIFGTSKDITIGPTAILSLMVSTYNIPHCGDMAVLLSFCIGIILLLMGIFRLGFLVRFVSVPVISAFTSAAAITIACGQIKNLNGLKNVPRDFFQNLIYTFKKIKEWNLYDLAFGCGCMVVLFLMRLLCTKLKWQNENLPPMRGRCYKFLWLLGIARNAILVMFSCCIIYIMEISNFDHPLTLIADVEFGLPGINAPEFTIEFENKTYEFVDTLKYLNSGLLIIPLIAFIEAIAIGKAFSRINNYKIEPRQELIALGISNILGSFVSSYPVTGSFSRTAVNSQSGVRTPIAGLFTGTVVLLAIRFLTFMFHYIPKACLGAIIISAVIYMVDVKIVKDIWTIKKLDLLPFFTTFFGCFYTLDVGLVLGIGVSLILVLYPIINPKIDDDIKEITVIRLHDGLHFAGVEKISNRIDDIIRQQEPPIAIILDMSGVTQIDFSVVVEIRGIITQMRTRLPGTELLVTKTCFDVKRVLIMAGLHDIITSSENVRERYQEGQRLLYD